MKKTVLMIIAIIILLIISMFVGYYIYKTEISDGQDIAMNTNEQQVIKEERNLVTEQVSTQEEKVTPNTEFVLRKHYNTCGHTTINYVEIPSEIVNMTEEEVKKEYSDWNVKQFSAEQVILEKQEEGTCDEHYILREKDGYIAVYWVNQNGQESLKEITGIATEYLTQNDLMEIEEGIFVYGLQELNSKLEDYE